MDQDRQTLIDAARQAAERAFLTAADGTRYGAAVRTTSGRIFAAGQYSSFNHMTNVHAEMAAIVTATMAGCPDITTLVIVSTAAQGAPARPCGVCRQFLLEHAQRIGRDFSIVMVDWAAEHVEEQSVNALLPMQWSSDTMGRVRPTQSKTFTVEQLGRTLAFGDQVQSKGRFLSLVWHPQWSSGVVLVKLKYIGEVKARHSFTDYSEYGQQLLTQQITTALPWGDPAYLLPTACIDRVFPRVPLARYPLAHFRPLLDLMAEADVFAEDVFLTGSWATGMANGNSDWDMIIRASPARLAALRRVLSRAILAGRSLSHAIGSNTVAFLTQNIAPIEDLLKEARFAETFTMRGPAGDLRLSLIYEHPDGIMPAPLVGQPLSAETMTFSGTVIDAQYAVYKPSLFLVQPDVGKPLRIECWHKLGTLVQDNDWVQGTAQSVDSEQGRRYFQFDSTRDVLRIDRRSRGTS